MSLIRIDIPPAEGASMVRVPIMGHALCAGFPSPADDFLEGAIELPRWLVPNPPASFLWNVRGDSMRRAGIFDRDLALADRSLTPAHGSVVVAAVDGLMSIKRYLIVGNTARLAFDSEGMPVYAVEEYAEVTVWGVVRFSIRWHVARGARVR